MANPQKENGHTGISNELLDAIIKYRVSGVEFQCLLFIMRKTYGWNKKADAISLSQFAEATGHKRQNVGAALKSLSCKNIIAVMKNHDRVALKYSVNKDFETWVPVMKKHACNEKSLQPVMKNHDKPVMKNHAYKRHIKDTTKERYTPTENSKVLTSLFLGTLSFEFQEKFTDHQKWQKCFDRLLKEFDVDRLKVLVLFYRREDFWIRNFMSPLKLLNKNKDGIRYVDYFFERFESDKNPRYGFKSQQSALPIDRPAPGESYAQFEARREADYSKGRIIK